VENFVRLIDSSLAFDDVSQAMEETLQCMLGAVRLSLALQVCAPLAIATEANHQRMKATHLALKLVNVLSIIAAQQPQTINILVFAIDSGDYGKKSFLAFRW
jgi:hypothetical protein